MSQLPSAYRLGGMIMVPTGLAIAVIGSRYEIGTLVDMGPGFLPTVLGLLLAGLAGLDVLVNGASRPAASPADDVAGLDERDVPFDLRGGLAIVGAILAFAFLAQTAGLAIATFVSVALAAAGDRRASWRTTLALSLAVTVFGVVVFGYLLHVPIPILRRW